MKYLLMATCLLLVACKQEVAEAPEPVSMTADALSFFCQMSIGEHGGPKGQIHLEDYPQPLFFGQVRDLVAYIKAPERDAQITAIYVSDTGAAQSWDVMGVDNWISADETHFVVGARVAGGMGAQEIVPFASSSQASEFADIYGGDVMMLDLIPDSAALGPVDLNQQLETPL